MHHFHENIHPTLQPSWYSTATNPSTSADLLKRLEEKILLENVALAITPDGQIINPFNHPLFAVYRCDIKIRPLLINRYVLEKHPELFLEKIKIFLSTNKDQYKTIANVTFNLLKSSIKRNFSQSKSVHKAVGDMFYHLSGYKPNASEIARVEKLIDAADKRGVLNDALIEKLTIEIERIFKYRLEENINNAELLLAEITKFFAENKVDNSLRQNILEQFNPVLQNPYTKTKLLYLLQHPDFIFFAFSNKSLIESLATYIRPNTLAGTEVGAFAITYADIIAVPVVESGLPLYLQIQQAKMLSPLPAVYGGIIGT